VEAQEEAGEWSILGDGDFTTTVEAQSEAGEWSILGEGESTTDIVGVRRGGD
jgi:hypothetical protein